MQAEPGDQKVILTHLVKLLPAKGGEEMTSGFVRGGLDLILGTFFMERVVKPWAVMESLHLELCKKNVDVAPGDMVGSECGAALIVLKACSSLNDPMIFWVFHHAAVKENHFSWASWRVPGHSEPWLC